MQKVLEKLKSRGIPLDEMTGLEFFAREGDWQTIYLYEKIRELHAWELESKYEEKLRANLPNAKVLIGNSFELIKNDPHSFDFIVLDNPQGFFGPNNIYCEHFEGLPLIAKSLKKGKSCVVMFNVNVAPFDYANNDEWRQRREAFYGISGTEKLDEGFLMKFYQRKFNDFGFAVEYCFLENRNDEYLRYLVLVLKSD